MNVVASHFGTESICKTGIYCTVWKPLGCSKKKKKPHTTVHILVLIIPKKTSAHCKTSLLDIQATSITEKSDTV